MAAQTFTLVNNGAITFTVNSIQFYNTTSVRHSANLSNFTGGSTAYTATSFVTNTTIATGASKSFSVDYTTYSTATTGTFVGSIVIAASNGSTSTTATITTNFQVW